jgi:hypothetical protein
MSVIAAKYFKDVGWVLAKNVDLTYKPKVRIRKSFRREIERLYIWNETTKYTEGLNEFGVGIVCAKIDLKDHDFTGAKNSQIQNLNPSNRTYYSPDGLRIRTALFESNVLKAAKKLVEFQITGNALVADSDRCFVFEGAYIKDNEGDEKYVYKVVEVPKEKFVVRTNHGILLPFTGFQSEDPTQSADRASSEIRYKKVVQGIQKANTFQQLLEVMSDKKDINPQLNPLRMDNNKGVQRTTGQIIIVPGETTLHYRAIWCEIQFNLEQMNQENEKTFFEIVSTRKLIAFKDR